jgi:hypothetical protein
MLMRCKIQEERRARDSGRLGIHPIADRAAMWSEYAILCEQTLLNNQACPPSSTTEWCILTTYGIYGQTVNINVAHQTNALSVCPGYMEADV